MPVRQAGGIRCGGADGDGDSGKGGGSDVNGCDGGQDGGRGGGNEGDCGGARGGGDGGGEDGKATIVQFSATWHTTCSLADAR